MLRSFVSSPGEALVVAEVSGPEDIPDGGWAWIDLVLRSPNEISELGLRFELSSLAIEDASSDTHFPKVDDYGSHLFVVFHGITERDGRLETTEIDAFLGENYLITVHHGESPSIEWEIEEAVGQVTGPDAVLARLAETASRRLLPLVDSLDLTVDDLEERAINGDGSVVPEIQALRRDAIRLRRVVGPQRSVLLELSSQDFSQIDVRARRRFSSAFDHHVRVYESLDGARALLGSVLDSYRGAVAEKMNEVMKVLTVYSAILLPLSLLAGIYGMNFVDMPELSWKWGYFGLLSVMGVVGFGQWGYFARRGFVGSFTFRRVPRVVGQGLVKLVHLPISAITALGGAIYDDTPPEQAEAGDLEGS